jgi:hypothetical protein
MPSTDALINKHDLSFPIMDNELLKDVQQVLWDDGGQSEVEQSLGRKMLLGRDDKHLRALLVLLGTDSALHIEVYLNGLARVLGKALARTDEPRAASNVRRACSVLRSACEKLITEDGSKYPILKAMLQFFGSTQRSALKSCWLTLADVVVQHRAVVLLGDLLAGFCALSDSWVFESNRRSDEILDELRFCSRVKGACTEHATALVPVMSTVAATKGKQQFSSFAGVVSIADFMDLISGYLGTTCVALYPLTNAMLNRYRLFVHANKRSKST